MNLTKTISLVVMCIFLIGAIVGCNPQPAPQTPAAPPAAPAGSPAAPEGSPAAPAADPEVSAVVTSLYDYIQKGDDEKLAAELLKKEVAEKIKTAKPEELGDMGVIIAVTKMIKDKKAEATFRDLKVAEVKVEGDKAEAKMQGFATLKFADSKEPAKEDTVEDTILLEKEDGKWKVVGISGKKKTEEVKPEGDAPKTEGEAPKVEGDAPKTEAAPADAPKTEGEAAPKTEGEKTETK